MIKITVIFSPLVAGVNDLSRTDSRKVAVTLICKYELIGVSSLDTCSYRRSTSVRSFKHIAFKIIISHNRASDRTNTDSFALDTHFVNYFGYKSVYYTVSTAGAIVGGHVCQSVRSFKFRH